MAGRRVGTSSVLTETTSEVACFLHLTAWLWLRYRHALVSTDFVLRIEVLMKVKTRLSSSGRTSVGNE